MAKLLRFRMNLGPKQHMLPCLLELLLPLITKKNKSKRKFTSTRPVCCAGGKKSSGMLRIFIFVRCLAVIRLNNNRTFLRNGGHSTAATHCPRPSMSSLVSSGNAAYKLGLAFHRWRLQAFRPTWPRPPFSDIYALKMSKIRPTFHFLPPPQCWRRHIR